jgi:CRISPR type I-A-associated protein Csa5
VSKEDVVMESRDFSHIVNALTAASLLMKSTTLLDRMAYALTTEQALRSISDSMRVISSGLTSSQIIHSKEQSQKSSDVWDVLLIKPANSNITYKIYGTLPTNDEVSKVVDQLNKDIRLAKKIGAIALANYAKVLERYMGGSEKHDNNAENKEVK